MLEPIKLSDLVIDENKKKSVQSKVKTSQKQENINVNKIIDNQLIATNAMTEVAKNIAKAPQLTHLIQVLVSALNSNDKNNSKTLPIKDKKLIINRDKKGLITTIDIKEI